jgi:uncharacterized protein
MEDYSKKSINSCKNCWAIGLCSICFIKSHHEGKFLLSKKQTYCESMRKNLLNFLKKFCSITEKNPDAFTHLKIEDELS